MAIPSEQTIDTAQTGDVSDDLQEFAEETTRQMRQALRVHGWLVVDKSGPRPRQAPHIRFWMPARTEVLRQIITGLERLQAEDCP